MTKPILTKECGKIIQTEFNISEFLTTKQGYIEGRDFAGMRFNHLDCCPYKSFLAHTKRDLIANIILPEKEILFLPYKNTKSGNYPNLFYDQTKAMGDGGIFQYTGNLEDALRELKEDNFSFSIARFPELREALELKINKTPPEKRFIKTKENVSIGEIFK
jgi:hypothetical protein